MDRSPRAIRPWEKACPQDWTSDQMQTSPRQWLGLEGERVLIVGAGSFGRACAMGFSDQSAEVVVADRSDQALRELKHAMVMNGMTECDTYQIDVQSSQASRELVGSAQSVLGGLDVVIHAIGVNDRRLISDTSDESWSEILTTNLTSAFWLARESTDFLRQSGQGKMVFFSSVSAILAHPRHGAYAASKAGLNQLLSVLAMELASDGIRVNGIAPGYVETNLTFDYLASPGVRDDLESRVPMGRLGEVQDVVGPTLFLSSEQSNFITGHIIVVDGGRSLD